MNVNGGFKTVPVKQNDGRLTIKDLITSMQGQIKKALPSVMTPERFTRMVFTALSTNQELMACTPQSFLGAMMQAAQLGLEPNTPLGQAYLIPYKNHGRLECQFQIGYKGLLSLAYRSGQITDIQAHEVHENDVFEVEYGLEPKLKHVPVFKDRGAVILYYAVYHTKDGGSGFEFMSKEDIQAFAKKSSKSYGSSYSPWTTYFDEMAKKTVLKRVLKMAPLAADFARAVAADSTIKTVIGDDMTVLPDESERLTIDQEQEAEPEDKKEEKKSAKKKASEKEPEEEIPFPGEDTLPGVDPETGEILN